MEKYVVFFEENGDEYTGNLKISCESFKQVNEHSIDINGALIEIDERIIEIKKIE